MSVNDIWISARGGRLTLPTYRWQIAAGTPVLVRGGEPVKQSASGSNTVILLVDADMSLSGAFVPMVGIAATPSSETASTAGYLDVYIPANDIIWETVAKTLTLIDTQAEIDPLVGERKVIDLSSSRFTMDTAAADSASNVFLIVGGDPAKSTAWFMILSIGTVLTHKGTSLLAQ